MPGAEPYVEAICSSRVIASRSAPRASRAIASSPSSGTLNPSCSAMKRSRATIASMDTRRKSKRWQRDVIVAGISCSSVVARMKMACGGGSSSVFSSALKAPVVSMCTSSSRYTLRARSLGAKAILSRSSRTSSMPRLLAASISIRSSAAPALIASQGRQALQGSPSRSSPQFTALARMRAVVVLPVPRGPANR